MPQHPKVSISLVKNWSRTRAIVEVEDVEALLLTLVMVDAALVRHGRTDLSRALRKDVARITNG